MGAARRHRSSRRVSCSARSTTHRLPLIERSRSSTSASSKFNAGDSRRCARSTTTLRSPHRRTILRRSPARREHWPRSARRTRPPRHTQRWWHGRRSRHTSSSTASCSSPSGAIDDAEAQYEVFLGHAAALRRRAASRPTRCSRSFHRRSRRPGRGARSCRGSSRRQPVPHRRGCIRMGIAPQRARRRGAAAIDRRTVVGYRSARFHYHAGMISLALGDEARARVRAHDVRWRSIPYFTRSMRDVAREHPGRARSCVVMRRARITAAAIVGLAIAAASSAPDVRPRTRSATSASTTHTRCAFTADRIVDEAVVDIAEIPTAQADADGRCGRRRIDLVVRADRHGTSTCAAFADALELSVDGVAVPFTVIARIRRAAPGHGGIWRRRRIECTFDADRLTSRSAARWSSSTTTTTSSVGWREIIAIGDGMQLIDSTVPTESTTDALRDYPVDLLQLAPRRPNGVVRAPRRAARQLRRVLPQSRTRRAVHRARSPRAGHSAPSIDRVTGVFDDLVGRRDLTARGRADRSCAGDRPRRLPCRASRARQDGDGRLHRRAPGHGA